MRKVLICLCLLIACSFSGCTKPDDVQKHVEEIYGNVYCEYLKHFDDRNLSQFYFDSLYYSAEFYRLHRQIGELEDKLCEPIIHDVDYWICGQDFDRDLAFRVLRVKMDGNRKAKVTINIHNCGQDREQVLTMVCERGRWLVDDMDDGAMKARIKRLIKEYRKK